VSGGYECWPTLSADSAWGKGLPQGEDICMVDGNPRDMAYTSSLNWWE
jgi:hypothetical protein